MAIVFNAWPKKDGTYLNKMKILTIVGARPQFIKAAMVSRALMAHNRRMGAAAGERTPSFPWPEGALREEILHTGQHYDPNMSAVFFDQLGIPAPAANLDINGGSHGQMTGRMLAAIVVQIQERRPDLVMVYGDTNSTLAGALAAAKLHVPVAHVEAGLRSFNRRMPEEINRVLTDHVAALLFCPTRTAVDNLAREGICDGVYHVGDVMYDAAQCFADMAAARSTILEDLGLARGQYLLSTVHRAENTDDPRRLENILEALALLSQRFTVVFPLHPRTRRKIEDGARARGASPTTRVKLIPPVSFLDMVQLEKNARCILTDSGGVQKEAYFHRVPCVTLRDETEWRETVAAGWNQLAGTDVQGICRAVDQAGQGGTIVDYGDGACSHKIVQIMAVFARADEGWRTASK
jgi:UDP-GlcNAc3NAcA epimerase